MNQLTIDSKALNGALRKLSPAFSGKSIMPILENVKIAASQTRLTITGTDLKITLSYQIAGIIDLADFEWLLPYKELLNITSILSGPVTIEVDDNGSAVLKYGRDVFKLGSTENASLYPQVPEVAAKCELEVNGTFFWSLQQAAKSTVQNELEMIFCCVLLDLREKEMRIVGCDRHRLYLHKMPAESKAKLQAMFYLDFVKSVKDFEDATLTISDKFISASNGTLTVIATLSDQKYPDYAIILPAEDKKPNCEVAVADLQRAVEKVMVYNTTIPVAGLSFGSDGILVSLVDEGTGRAADTLVPADHQIEEMKVHLNVKMLKEELGQLPHGAESMKCIIDKTRVAIYPQSEDFDITILQMAVMQ